MVCYRRCALIGVVFMSGVVGCGLEWEEFGDLSSSLGGSLPHDQSVSNPQELWVVQEPTADTGTVSFPQTLLSGKPQI